MAREIKNHWQNNLKRLISIEHNVLVSWAEAGVDINKMTLIQETFFYIKSFLAHAAQTCFRLAPPSLVSNRSIDGSL